MYKRQDVGAVGARLYYEDDTIQHAGVVIGFGGIAGHCFVQQKRGTDVYKRQVKGRRKLPASSFL